METESLVAEDDERERRGGQDEDEENPTMRSAADDLGERGRLARLIAGAQGWGTRGHTKGARGQVVALYH